MADFNLLNEILNTILVCSCNLLEFGHCNEGPSKCGCPCRAFLSAGPPAWDDCCNSQLAVYARDLYPFSNFPSRSSSPSICTPSLAANVTVQLVRCWPVIKEDGAVPTVTELQAASTDIYRDQYLLTEGLICCLKTGNRKRQFVLNGSRIVGPQGGCVAIEVDLSIEIFSL